MEADAPKVGIVDLSDIEFGKRFRVDYGDLSELVDSLKSSIGVIQPFAICTTGVSDPSKKYRLLAGGRRYKGCEQAGISIIPARIYDRELTNVEMRVIELAENYLHKSMTWQEQSSLVEEIHNLQITIHGEKTSTAKDAPGWSQAKTAEMMGLSKSTITNHLKLARAKLIPEVNKCKDANDAHKLLGNMANKIIVSEIAKRERSKAAATPQDVHQKQLVDRYIVGDFFEGVRKVPSGSIDLCEVDPPYGIDLGRMKKQQNLSIDTKLTDYNEIDASEYATFLQAVAKECYRVLKPTGWIVFWFGKDPWFETVFRTLSSVGFEGNRMTGMWLKKGGQTKQPTLHMPNQVEEFFYLRKQAGVLHQMRGGNVFDYSTVAPQRKTHPTERPIELIQDIIRTFCLPGSSIMVPFLGSGATILASDNENCQAFGWEMEPSYKDFYTVKVYSARQGVYSSYT